MSGSRLLPAIEKLQEQAGIEPERRIRVQGALAYVGTERATEDLAPEPDAAAARQIPTMNRDAAVQWFRNRRDDATLIDNIYAKQARGNEKAVRNGASSLRAFARSLAQDNPQDTLRDFLRRYSSANSARRQSARDQGTEFSTSKGIKAVLRAALEDLAGMRLEQPEPVVDAVGHRFGTRLRDMLPPPDQKLIQMVEERLNQDRPDARHNLPNTLAHFGAELLDNEIGGLSEWLSMQRNEHGPQAKVQAKKLVDEYVAARDPRSPARHGIHTGLGLLQDLAGVDRRYRVRSRTGEMAVPPSSERPPGPSVQPDELPRFNTWPQHGHRSKRAREAGSTSAPSVKLEPTAAALHTTQHRAATYVETQLDQARTAFYRDLGLVCDLTGKEPQWSAHLDRHDAVVVRHSMSPMLENDHKFPLRDPEKPLERAHPRYADPQGNGKCHANVKLKSVRLSSGFRRYLANMAKSDERFRIDPRQVPDLVKRLEADAAQELKRLIREQHAAPRCQPRKLLAEDVQPHERMLIGQHGLFVPRHANPAERPTLSNGRILGFYVGAMVENDHDLAQTQAAHPDYERYAMDAHTHRGAVTYSAMGAANSIAFANTALQPDAPEPAFDHQRLNAVFIQFDASLTDKDERPRREGIVAMVARDNLFDSDKPQAQVLADYGDAFLDHFRKPETATRAVQVKSERGNE